MIVNDDDHDTRTTYTTTAPQYYQSYHHQQQEGYSSSPFAYGKQTKRDTSNYNEQSINIIIITIFLIMITTE